MFVLLRNKNIEIVAERNAKRQAAPTVLVPVQRCKADEVFAAP
jgi:hypothetical protein